ncbi:7758_t:CDS:2 [Ambispora gerdemannii]|uniref:Ribose-5-phosphate isomerase n=1 Tax=Ambispora gerdemannii TaxID=144530 RepID=A0A9N8WKM1_9GLOM|nr:7758_t:CDS:2 [Ambispora gerdemannii]
MTPTSEQTEQSTKAQPKKQAPDSEQGNISLLPNNSLHTVSNLPTPPSIFGFRSYLRNFYDSTVPGNSNNNRNTNPSLNSSGNEKPKLDEMCLQWCLQKDTHRNEGKEPDCRMFCLRRKKVKEKQVFVNGESSESDGGSRDENSNPEEKDGVDQKTSREHPYHRSRWNFLDGYHLAYFKGAETCQSHTEEMKDSTQHTPSNNTNPLAQDQDQDQAQSSKNRTPQKTTKEYEIDLGEKFENTKTATRRVITRAFTPGYELAKRYVESWNDGTQTAFFTRFYESVQRLDAVYLVQDNIKRAFDEWVRGGGDGNSGFGGGVIEEVKRKAAYQAVDHHITNSVRLIGIGSGSTIEYVVERLLQRGKEANANFVFIPTSFQSRHLIVHNGLTLGDVDQYPEIDVTIDGADEVDENLNAIKGGGGCHLREKVVAEAAKKFIIVADYRKNSKTLGEKWKQGIPIEVISFAHTRVIAELKKLGCENPTLRMAKAKAGPVITDNGNLVIDAYFGLVNSPGELLRKIKLLTGVVEVGLFVDMTDVVYFGNADGSVSEKKRSLSGVVE